MQQRIAPPGESSSRSPILAFVLLERYNAIKLIQNVHASLAALSKVIRGSQLLSKEVHELAQALMAQEVGATCATAECIMLAHSELIQLSVYGQTNEPT